MIKENIDINKLIEDVLSGQDDRSRRIVLGRYGLDSKRKKTLAELGREYDLTRERIRQIQANSLKAIREEIGAHKEAIKLLKLLEDYLKDAGNIRRGDLIANDLSIILGERESAEDLFNKLQFIADALEWPKVAGGNEDWHVVWYTEGKAYETAKKLVKELLGFKSQDFEEFLKVASEQFNMPETQIINHLLISRRFGIGPYGDLGPDHWIDVNPKTVRDKIYLVLQKSDKPLHFNEIAELVNRLSAKKRATATVHNELIKDARFSLVGRGTYAINA